MGSGWHGCQRSRYGDDESTDYESHEVGGGQMTSKRDEYETKTVRSEREAAALVRKGWEIVSSTSSGTWVTGKRTVIILRRLSKHHPEAQAQRTDDLEAWAAKQGASVDRMRASSERMKQRRIQVQAERRQRREEKRAAKVRKAPR